MCGLSVRSHGKKKTFPMISVDDGRSETLSFLSTTIYLRRNDSVHPSLRFFLFPFPFPANRPDNFVRKKHSKDTRWADDTRGGTLIYRTRAESNVDKESRMEWGSRSRRGRVERGGKGGDTILGRSTGRYTEPTVNHASVAIGLNFLRLRVPKSNSYTPATVSGTGERGRRDVIPREFPVSWEETSAPCQITGT